MKDDFEDIEQLSAYLDDALTTAERQDVQTRLLKDREFSLLHQQLKRNDLAYRETVSSIDQQPIPAAILHALETKPDAARRNGLINQYFHNKVLPRLAATSAARQAVAASLFAMVGAALFFLAPQDRETDVAVALNSKIVRQALSDLVAGQSVTLGEAELTEVFAFMRDDGVLCKHFTLTSPSAAVSAVSCDQQGQWDPVIVEQMSSPVSEGEEYQPAGAKDAPSVDQYIHNRIQGTSLSIEQEKRAMKKN